MDEGTRGEGDTGEPASGRRGRSAAEPRVGAARACAEAAWAWTLDQVRWDDDGPWIPERVPVSGPDPGRRETPPGSDEIYQGIAGLGLALSEVRLTREWTDEERSLADRIVTRLRAADLGGECGLYTGLAGSMTVVGLLAGGGDEPLLARLGDLWTPLGWPSPELQQAASNDLLMGTAGIVLALVWRGGDDALRLAALGADALVGVARRSTNGVEWKMFEGDRDRLMPNYSHGTAGIATALAVAGWRLGRSDLVELARRGAEQLVSVADTSGDGFRAPLQIPRAEGYEEFSYGWCHGPTGTANLFGALELAGVDDVGGRTPGHWRSAAARTVATSGLPERRYDGFWDNDGRCCGTAGVLDAVLNHVQHGAVAEHLAFADRLAAALVERSEPSPADPGRRYWRFYEHRVDPPHLDPGVGWMQGAAGIAAALLRYARVRESGPDAARLALPDDWWMTPSGTLTPCPPR